MKTYDRCPPDVMERVKLMVQRFHAELRTVEATFDLLFVSTDGDEPALTHNGWPALAVTRATNPKERALGHADALIIIDRARYVMLSLQRQDALLDHELEHLEVKKDKKGAFEYDDQRRPKLKLRKHDVQVGWFESVALRHREDSNEVVQAEGMMLRYRPAFFCFMLEEVTGRERQP